MLQYLKRKEFWERLAVCLLLLKMFLNPFPQITAVHEICFYTSAAVFVVLLCRREASIPLRQPFLVVFTALAVWSILGIPFALHPANTLHDIYAHLFKYIVLFCLFVQFLGTGKRLRFATWGIVLSTSLFALWEMASYYLLRGEPLSMKLNFKMPGEIPTNIIGVLTVFAIATALYLMTETRGIRTRIFLGLCISALIAATLATQTMSSILALGLVLCIFAFRNRKTGAVMLLALLVLIAFMPIKHRLTADALRGKIAHDERMSIWLMYSEIVRDYPITGVGFGMQTLTNDSFLEKYNARVPEKYRSPYVYYAPHNFVVDLATRVGLVGLFLYLYLLYLFFRTGWTLAKAKQPPGIRHGAIYLMIALVASSFQGLFENTLHGPPLTIFYFLFAMMAILRDRASGPAGLSDLCEQQEGADRVGFSR